MTYDIEFSHVMAALHYSQVTHLHGSISETCNHHYHGQPCYLHCLLKTLKLLAKLTN